MKIMLINHDYKYAAEQMLLAPHGTDRPAGAPVFLIRSGGMNPPGVKVLQGKTLGTRHRARKGQQREAGWCA